MEYRTDTRGETEMLSWHDEDDIQPGLYIDICEPGGCGMIYQ